MLSFLPEQASRILIVDDSVTNIRLLGHMLKDLGEIFFATDGQTGLRLAQEKLPQLVLLDVEMPDIDGFEVCRQLKADPRTAGCAVIFVTAHSSVDHEVAALQAGAVDFISKPLNPPVVYARAQTQLTLRRQADILLHLAHRDGLTGAYDREYFDRQVLLEYRRHQRHGMPLALALIDIDHFHGYNEHYGNRQGDQCLRRLAETLNQGTRRPGELVARYDGDCFGVILPNTATADAIKYGLWIGDRVRGMVLPHEGMGANCFVTTSVGLASSVPERDESPEALLARAERALQQAKHNGRDRLAIGSEPLDTTSVGKE
ncbi:diguanylate cyclase domain-containing protein [Chitinimonas lacunae]|uniref:diguanylate cyclase n=1 Tax=Chitinimonas lacunae TaxID=1963018 RepID=A0ABV8MVA8_9NEIS